MSNQFLVSHPSSVRFTCFIGREETACRHEAGACSSKISNDASRPRRKSVRAITRSDPGELSASFRDESVNLPRCGDPSETVARSKRPQGLRNGISRRRVIKINYRFPKERAKYLKNWSRRLLSQSRSKEKCVRFVSILLIHLSNKLLFNMSYFYARFAKKKIFQRYSGIGTVGSYDESVRIFYRR